MNFLIEARDQYGNLRTASTAETFVVTLVSVTSATSTTISTTSNNNGTYTVNYMLTSADQFTLNVKFGGSAIYGSPFIGIVVSVGLV